MSNRRLSLTFLSSALALPVLFSVFGACSSSEPNPSTAPGTSGSTTTAGTANAAGTTATAGSAGAAGTAGTAGTAGAGGSTGTAGAAGSGGAPTGTAGSVATAGSGGVSTAGAGGASGAGAGGMSGGAGTAGAGGGGGPTLGCGMNPGSADSDSKFVKHDIEVTGVDQAFITAYPPNAGGMYNWTHRNYFVRLPKEYDSAKAYPITIGGSGCGGPETVGSEGGYAPLGIAAGEKEAIQVSLSYVLSSAANPDCNGAVFADGFPNSPEPQYLAAVVKDVQAKYCTDSTKVFLSGYSSGAFEAVTLGCSNANILRGTAVQIGGGLRVNGPKPCTGPVAAMFVVGLQDQDNPIGPLATPLHGSTGTAPARDELLTRNGCTGSEHKPWDPDYPMCETYTGCPAKFPVVWCAINSGHTPDQADPAIGKYRYQGVWKFWSTLP